LNFSFNQNSLFGWIEVRWRALIALFYLLSIFYLLSSIFNSPHVSEIRLSSGCMREKRRYPLNFWTLNAERSQLLLLLSCWEICDLWSQMSTLFWFKVDFSQFHLWKVSTSIFFYIYKSDCLYVCTLFTPEPPDQSPPNFAQTFPPTHQLNLTQAWLHQPNPWTLGNPKL